MIGASRRSLLPAGLLVVLLAGVNWWLEPDLAREFSSTSFGVGASGYKAAFDLAAEAGSTPTRSYHDPRHEPATSHLWMVAPSLLDPDWTDGETSARNLMQWIRGGGTALVFGAGDSAWQRLELPVHVLGGTDHAAVAGNVAAAPRKVAVPGLRHFSGVPLNATVVLRADDAPFAIALTVGKGRLIAVADERFLRNDHLGSADNSLLFVDLVRHFDRPVFDEHSHGMVDDISLYAAVMASRARLPLAVGLLLALTWILAQQTWPRRALDQPELPSPALAPFVESLGVLYARAADPAAAFRAYRAGFLRRLRRASTAFVEIDEAAVRQRIARDGGLLPATRHWLLEPQPPRNNAELVEAIQALEAYPGVTHG